MRGGVYLISDMMMMRMMMMMMKMAMTMTMTINMCEHIYIYVHTPSYRITSYYFYAGHVSFLGVSWDVSLLQVPSVGCTTLNHVCSHNASCCFAQPTCNSER